MVNVYLSLTQKSRASQTATKLSHNQFQLMLTDAKLHSRFSKLGCADLNITPKRTEVKAGVNYFLKLTYFCIGEL